MRLYTKCTSCREFIHFHESVQDRFKLAAKKGAKMELHCKSCNVTGEYHVNDIRAEASKRLSLLASLIFLLGTGSLLVFIWDYLFQLADIYAMSGLIGILTIPFMIYYTINHEQENKVRSFNLYKYV